MKKIIVAVGVLTLLASTAATAESYGGPEYQSPGATGSQSYGSAYNSSTAVSANQVSWAGLYVGGTIGESWGKAKTSLKAANNGQSIVSKDISPKSAMWGGYVGYNFETTNRMVIGIETDFLWNTDDSSGNKLYIPDANDPSKVYNYQVGVKQKWNGATRLRLGFIKGASNRFLPYIAAGISYADIKARAGTNPINNATQHDSKVNSEKRTGWNIGAGLDYVPPVLNNRLILRAEYRYTDLGHDTYNNGTYNNANTAAANIKQKVKFQQNDIRFGIAFKF